MIKEYNSKPRKKEMWNIFLKVYIFHFVEKKRTNVPPRAAAVSAPVTQPSTAGVNAIINGMPIKATNVSQTPPPQVVVPPATISKSKRNYIFISINLWNCLL